MGRALLALLGLGFASCTEQTLDLRSPETPRLVCAPNQRVNPATGRCSTCERVAAPPEQVCLCASEPLPNEFPWCEGETPFRCLPCLALDACRDFNSADATVGDCGGVRACCADIERNDEGTACCGRDQIAVCFDHPTIDGALSLECVDMATCCDAVPCGDTDECEGFQECIGGFCRPGCEPSSEFCCEDCDTECRCESLDGPT
ncbi:MAG: hypothetical protein AAF654_08155 [Myxococcota bacterium]